MNKVALNIPAEDVLEGERLIASTLLNKGIQKPSIVEALLKQAEVVEKEVEGPSIIGTSVVSKEVVAQTLEENEEDVQHASDTAETVGYWSR